MAGNYLRLTFLTDLDHTETLRVEHPMLGLTEEQIKNAMEGMAAVNVYANVSGKIITPFSAELITVDETELVTD